MKWREVIIKIVKHLSDKQYICLQYRNIMGRWPDINEPKTFSEKLQYLKLHDRRAIYTKLADKLVVREIIKDLLGEKYLVPLIGQWDSVEGIDFSKLPCQFVLKCNHDSGSTIVCRDLSKLNIEEAKGKLANCMKRNAYNYAREWPYKNIPRKIMVEEYMCANENSRIVDYKFYCFGTVPKFLYISRGLEDHATASITFYNLEGKRTDFQRTDFKLFEEDLPLPENFNEMVNVAETIAKFVNNSFVRVDLYSVNNNIYFSEITFTPCAGYMLITPEEWDRKLGDMLLLN